MPLIDRKTREGELGIANSELQLAAGGPVAVPSLLSRDVTMRHSADGSRPEGSACRASEHLISLLDTYRPIVR